MNTQPPPYAGTPAPAPNRWPTIALVGLVMLIVGAAAGWFLQPQFDDGESVETEASADTADTSPAPATDAPTTVAPTTTVAALPRLAHTSGSFSIADPGKGWQAQLDGTSSLSETPIIRYAQNVETYRADGNAPGFSIANLTDTAATPEEYLTAGGSPECPLSPMEPFTRGDFTGFRNTMGPCPATAEYGALTAINVTIAGTRPDGSEIGMLIHVTPESAEEMVLQALDSFSRP